MSPMYEVTGYDCKTGRLVAFYAIPPGRIPSVKKIAGVPSSDDGLGSYPLDRDQLSAIARILKTPINKENLDYFLEAYAEGANQSAAAD
jgi:hypothetical protein